VLEIVFEQVCGNKIDMKNAKSLLRELRKASDLPVVGVSALTGENIGKLALNLRSMMMDAEAEHLRELEEEVETKKKEDMKEVDISLVKKGYEYLV
jgi:50S ribosomal subunit-associated GTPase HflX